MQPSPTAELTSPPQRGPVAISVVVPVHNGAGTLGRCLEALAGSSGPTWECIVVIDGATDDSANIARRWGARVLTTGPRAIGPARARNIGGRAATAPLLCFVDADVVVRQDTLARFAALFEADADLAAVFGSYDTVPAAPGLLSQYRNLLHHFVHQSGNEMASTFWAGCGAVRRSTFLDLGGFDETYTRPSIEDIELGYRLQTKGKRIRLAKDIQVTHLKRWTLWSILCTDLRDRALPWSVLVARTHRLPNDLNVGWSSRVSAVSVYALLGLLVRGRWQPSARWSAIVPLVTLLVCNRGLYAFFLRQRGPWFLLRVLPVHWLYFAYSTLTFAACMPLAGLSWLRMAARAPEEP